MPPHGSRPVEEIASLATGHGFRIGVAESLTGGHLAAALAAGPEASEWFRGGVVAYAADVKYDLLGVTPGPLVSDTCARQMARGAARVLGADATVAVTGVGGPEPEEGQPPGTVYVAIVVLGRERCLRLDLSGAPDDVLARTIDHALEILHEAVRDEAARVSAPPRPDTARDAGPAGSPIRAASP